MIYFVSFWILCSVLTSILAIAMNFDSFQKAYKKIDNILIKIFIIIFGIVLNLTISLMFGPIGLILQVSHNNNKNN